jgi:cytochrome c oxidase accessory protein FixG
METDKGNKDNSYRDTISTVGEDGDRVWVYPKKPVGKHYDYRKLVSYGMLAFLFTGPFIKINGEPLLMLNFIERKFVLLGQIFWPQDFYIFLFATLTFIVFIVLFTLAFGRLFCGWVCPQTIFMEMLFRRIEYWIEGDFQHQKALDKKKGTKEYFVKKGAKHVIFFIISWHISNTFLAYIMGGDELFRITTENPADHVVGIVSMFIFTFIFYGVFAKMREQVCTTICPYGRLQGALLDHDSLIVAYDYVRGEGRGKFKKNENRPTENKGDCIDCNQCVNVCPTGIDIRNGTQLECVNCTACIDACDFMMDKVGMNKGLVRFASEANIAENKPYQITLKVKAYSAVLAILFVGFIALLFSRSDIDATVLRTPGLLYQTQEDGRISNLFNYKLINKTTEPLTLSFEIDEKTGEVKLIGSSPTVEPNGVVQGTFFVIFERRELDGLKTRFHININSEEKEIKSIKSTFVGPPNKK